MERLRFRIDKVFKGATRSLDRFPAAIISAIAISIITIIRISMGWEVQRPYNLLLDSIQISFLLGAVFSMVAMVFYEIRSHQKKSAFILTNIAGIVVAAISFLLLYFYGGKISGDEIAYLSSIAQARVSVAILISGIAFVYMISKSKSVNSFSDSFFITHKAFVVSALYGLVIMLGVSGVLGAFEALVYNGMDYRVYQYLGVAVGFLTYMIFLGYFPSFREMENDIEIRKIKERPRFIVVLLDYIMTPIMLALTVVLLIWSVRVFSEGVEVSFARLSAIASSYVMIGIWLHIMVAKHESKITEFYKKAYPLAAILILMFEAKTLFGQLGKFGLKTAEYSFLMTWIFGLISVLLLLFLKERAYRKIAVTAVIIGVIWVLPVIGYEDITFHSQLKRLEKILIHDGLLVDGHIIAKDEEVEQVTKGQITDAVDFISYFEKSNLPNWFKKDLNQSDVFKDTFGFQKTYGVYPDESGYGSTSLSLETGMIDIRDYSLSLNMNLNEATYRFPAFEGKDDSYEIKVSNQPTGIPNITVKLEDRTILDQDLETYLSDLINKYPPEENREINLPFEDMSVVLEGEDLSILVVFNHINAYVDRIESKTSYYLDFQGIYIRYK